jgi:hypothetical protein
MRIDAGAAALGGGAMKLQRERENLLFIKANTQVKSRFKIQMGP